MAERVRDLSAYRSVLSVCSQQLRPGEIIAICAQRTNTHRMFTQTEAKSEIIPLTGN